MDTNKSKTSSATGRLPSFRTPRDLTLLSMPQQSGISSLGARPKKNFVPNIPVRRDKSDNIIESLSEKRPGKVKDKDKERQKGSGKGTGKTKEFIQTTGSLFGEGISATKKNFGKGGSSYRNSSKTDVECIQKPVINTDKLIDKAHEEQKLKELHCDDFIDDSEDKDLKRRDFNDGLSPVHLPMVDMGRMFKEDDVDQDGGGKYDSGMFFIKQEAPDHHVKPLKKPVCRDKGVKIKDDSITYKKEDQNKNKELSVPELLMSDQHNYIFIQMPSCLPSHPPDVKRETSSSKQNNDSEVMLWFEVALLLKEIDEKKMVHNCTLSDLPEGQIGTLKIYGSGKTELWFGGHKLILNKGTQVGFLQDIVSFDINEEERSGSITSLGHIQHRLVCTPEFEELLKHKQS